MKPLKSKDGYVPRLPIYDSFPSRSIGKQVRDAHDFGVYPDFVEGEVAHDDLPEEQGVIDPMCDPRMDRLTMLTDQMRKQNPNKVRVDNNDSTQQTNQSNTNPNTDPTPSVV